MTACFNPLPPLCTATRIGLSQGDPSVTEPEAPGPAGRNPLNYPVCPRAILRAQPSDPGPQRISTASNPEGLPNAGFKAPDVAATKPRTRRNAPQATARGRHAIRRGFTPCPAAKPAGVVPTRAARHRGK